MRAMQAPGSKRQLAEGGLSIPQPGKPARPRKLSYKDQRELDALPELIDLLETRQGELEEMVAQSGFYQGDHTEVEKVLAELTRVQQELEDAFERWSELED